MAKPGVKRHNKGNRGQKAVTEAPCKVISADGTERIIAGGRRLIQPRDGSAPIVMNKKPRKRPGHQRAMAHPVTQL